MNIYEIDKQILNLFDDETGELSDIEAYESLQMERDKKIEGLCLWLKNLKAEAKAIKEEKDILYERQKTAENAAERVKKMIIYALQGEKFKTAKVNVSYRNSKSVKVDNEFIEWAKENNTDLLTYAEPKASLTAIKELIAQGQEVPHTFVEENKSIQIK